MKKNILIVDDDPDYLSLTKFYCEKAGFDTTTFDSQKAAEKYLAENKPDLAIYDLMMEKEDSGFILAYKTKQKYPDVPVIIATAVTAETGMIFGLEQKEERSWIKADLYLEKGLRADQLEREIKKLLKM